ncbi:MAG TPA: EAL domain-containing protein [Thiotrichales bacterium]|nr:EAL domain-containing protein [Thiotrichales bacterium]
MQAKKENPANIIKLSQSLQNKTAEIELLQQTFTEIGSEFDLERIFAIVSERAQKLIGAETLLIPLLDENCETYTYRAGAGKNVDEIVGESLPLDFGVCGWVWRHKRPWWKGVLDELAEHEKNKWEHEIGSMILVPLQGKQHFLGGIAGLNKTGGRDFDKKDLNLLQLFASIVSIAIENAMAVENMEASHALNEDYRLRLEVLNRQLVESSKELEFLSLYDSVTGLPNRSLFHDRLSQNITQAISAEQKIALLLIDLDSFKEINDELGHDRGDYLLHKIARRFEEAIQGNETLARLGGDEFVVVLPGHDEVEATRRAQHFIDLLKSSFTIDRTHLVVNASIGLSVYPDHGTTISTLLSHADCAMYQAKNSSQSVCPYREENDQHAQGRLALIADVRKALEENAFELYYQPKYLLSTHEVVSAEALGRWRSDARGDVSPAIFIELLEQNNLIDEYTYWAIETALKQAIFWKQNYKTVRVSVNISPQTLMHPGFIQSIGRIVKTRQDGELLCFEITENLFLSEFDRLSSVLEYICSLGITLSIDDYGTGYSSLSRLRRLPVSELKIDQSFIREMAENKDDEVIVHSTIELSHNLGLNVVAEGVETREAYELLQKLGCDTVQGFYMAKPVSAAQFTRILAKE